MKKNRSCLIAPAAVMLIMLSVFFVCGMFPFGSKTLSWCDMNQQVIPFLMDFKDILSGKTNMFLNMQNSGGMNFWGVFLFFISSPFTFLVAFVNKADIYLFVNILVLLKMMTCAFTASIFFHYRFKNLSILQNSAISVMYAFCGYTMFYYQNHVWLDVMYLFPILLIGLLKLADEGKIALYVISFSAILTVNFYLSYMVSIFLVISSGIYACFFSSKESRRRNILLLGISTLIVAFITAVVWLPSLMQYISSARTGDIIRSLRVGNFFSRFDTTLAVILCTGAVFSALIVYLFFTRRQSKAAAFAFLVFILTFIPVLIEPINKMWHTGNYQAFPVRYGYITIFFGLILFAAIVSLINKENRLTQSRPLAVFGAMVAVSAVFLAECLILYKDYESVTVYTRTLWGNSESFTLLFKFAFTVSLAYFVLLLLYKYRQLSKTAFSVLLCTIVLLESVFNCCVYVASAANNVKSNLPVIDLGDRIQDDSLYRVKNDKKYFDVNLVGGLGYNTLSHYTSLTQESFMYMMKKLGYSSYWMEVNSNGGTKLTDAILGNKYSIVRTNEITSSDPIIYKNAKYAIKQNTMSLPVGLIMQSDRIKALENLPDTTRLNMQQAIFQGVFHTNEELFINYEPTSFDNITYTSDGRFKLTFPDNSVNGVITYKIPVKGRQTLYFECFDRLSSSLIEHINSSFNVFVNGKLIQENYPNQDNNGIVDLGTFQDETVIVHIDVMKEVDVKSFGLAGMKEDVLENAINRTTAAQLKQSGNKIIGTASAQNDDSYLLLPITYDRGFTAMINHKNAEVFRVFDSMMTVKLEKGANDISVTYVPSGFKTGAYLSVAGILLFIGFQFFLRKGFYKKIRFLEIPAMLLFTLLCISVFIMIYIFPVFVYLTA